MYVVYEHFFPNGKRYVGITCQNPKRRWRNGLGYKSNIRLTRAFKKYGWDNIEHNILFENISKEQAELIEIELIAGYDLTNEIYGYNLAVGGYAPSHTDKTKAKIGLKSIGRKHTDEFKRFVSELNKGENNYMYNKTHTQETKKKISESKKGCKGVNSGLFGGLHPSSRVVGMVDIETGNIVMTHNSIIEAAQYVNKAKSGISGVLSNKQKTCGGYKWVYIDE